MLEQPRRALLRVVAVAPVQERCDDGEQVDPLGGQAVLVSLRPLLVQVLLEHALVTQALQARGQHVAGNAEALLELVEAREPDEGVADDEHRPALADDLQRARDRADLALVLAVKHGHIVLQVSSLTQLTSGTVGCIMQCTLRR
jgi:hypothetical protein